MRDWTARLVANKCAQAGCINPPQDDNCRCVSCQRVHNERQAATKRQRYWYSKRQVTLRF